MTFEMWFTEKHPEIPFKGALAVLQLTEEGSTLPFIARYRKEVTGNFDEVAIQKSIDAKEMWDEIIKRQAFIVETIDNQKKLTPELKEKIMTTFNLEQLEDIYLPYKQKKKTKAVIAREAGLESFADFLWATAHGESFDENFKNKSIEDIATLFVNAEKNVKDTNAAITGATDIIVERLSETAELRQKVREIVQATGFIYSEKTDKAQANSKFEKYFGTHEAITSLMESHNSHRYLAMRRGWMEEELNLTLKGSPENLTFEENLIGIFEAAALTDKRSIAADIMKKAATLSLKAYVFPSIEKEMHKTVKTAADIAAINVFADNVKKVLLASPFGSKPVIGIDPGIRTGCKTVVIDASGKFILNGVLFFETESQLNNAKQALDKLIKEYKIEAIAIGNGTAGRETEDAVRKILKELNFSHVPVVSVNESGASIYSASETAREEFPDLDVTVRGAISIAHRFQDPLAELVKIDPKSIGVGQYQHDVSQPDLKKSIDSVVDSCVNMVGVDVNTASEHLLAHVSGIGPSLAKGIVNYRGKKGLFKSRTELLEIPRFSKKTFEQAAGFLRIRNAENPLDNTGVHPERYTLLENYAAKIGKKVSDLIGQGVVELKQAKELKSEIGEFTFADIIAELEKPGRDPREQFIPFMFREDIHDINDLKPGMQAPGIVTNVTNFGAFVDIGVHQDGLVHISELSHTFVKDPKDVVSPGDQVKVQVVEVDTAKRRIALTMKIGSAKAESGKPQHSNAGPNNSTKTGGFNNNRNPGQKPSVKPANQPFNNSFGALAGLKLKK